ncbi:uncharacterized protein LOC144126326 [Amblyomma americanum]
MYHAGGGGVPGVLRSLSHGPRRGRSSCPEGILVEQGWWQPIQESPISTEAPVDVSSIQNLRLTPTTDHGRVALHESGEPTTGPSGTFPARTNASVTGNERDRKQAGNSLLRMAVQGGGDAPPSFNAALLISMLGRGRGRGWAISDAGPLALGSSQPRQGHRLSAHASSALSLQQDRRHSATGTSSVVPERSHTSKSHERPRHQAQVPQHSLVKAANSIVRPAIQDVRQLPWPRPVSPVAPAGQEAPPPEMGPAKERRPTSVQKLTKGDGSAPPSFPANKCTLGRHKGRGRIRGAAPLVSVRSAQPYLGRLVSSKPPSAVSSQQRSTQDCDETASRTLFSDPKEEFLRVLSERSSATNAAPQPESSSTSRVPDSDADDYIFLQETKWPIKPAFLMAQKEVDRSIRQHKVQWLIDTRNALQFSPETLFLAVSLADRYLEGCVVDKRQMELLWAAALCVAVKHKEPEYHVVYRSYVASAKRMGESREQELCNMEEDVSRAVGWSLDLALPLDFLRRNCKAAEASKQEHLTAMYILEVCLVDYIMAWMPPSKKAASALYCAMHYQGRKNPCWSQKMQLCSGHAIGSLQPIVTRMQELLIAACESDIWTPYEIYEKKWSHTLG